MATRRNALDLPGAGQCMRNRALNVMPKPVLPSKTPNWPLQFHGVDVEWLILPVKGRGIPITVERNASENST